MSHDEIININIDAAATSPELIAQEIGRATGLYARHPNPELGSAALAELAGLPPLAFFGDLAPVADLLGCKPDTSAIIAAISFLRGAATVGASLPAAHVTAQATIAELRAERDRLRGELEAAKEHARIEAIAHDRALRALAATVRGES